MHRRVFCFDLSGVMYHQSQTKPARGAHDSVWDKFYEACLREDRPNLAFFAVFKGLYPSALIWTGRPEKFRERTLAKLLDDGMPIPLETLGEHLLMREDDERRPNRLLKKHWAKKLPRRGSRCGINLLRE